MDAVVRFAGPPLAEREWMAYRARETEVRRSEGSRSLEELMAERFGVVAEQLDWDSCRRADARWAVVVTAPSGETAGWVYDPSAASVMPDDDHQPAKASKAARPKLVRVSEPSKKLAPAVAEETVPEPVEEVVADVVELPQVVAETPGAIQVVDEADPAVDETEQLTAFETPQETPAPKRRRRAAVPSWDDIMFGTRGDGASPIA